jgi:predicted DNA-binding transcriptional regulator AlpA
MRTTATAWHNSAVLAWMRDKLAASGGDPTTIPDEPPAFWRLQEVERRIGLRRATLYRMAAQGIFPRPISISPGRRLAEHRSVA